MHEVPSSSRWQILMFRKIAMKNLCGVYSCCNSLFFGLKKPKVLHFFINIYVSSPFFSLNMPANSFVSRSVTFYFSYVHHVLRFCCAAKIAPSVVGWVLINVINLMRGPFSRHHSPNNPMRLIQTPVYANQNPPICGFMPSNISGFSTSRRWDAPYQTTHFWVIFKKSMQFRRVNHELYLPHVSNFAKG